MTVRYHRTPEIRMPAWIDAYQRGTDEHEPSYLDPWTAADLRFWLKKTAYAIKRNPRGELDGEAWAFRLARQYAPGLSDEVILQVARAVEREARYYCTSRVSKRWSERQARKGRLGGLASDSRPGGLARAVALHFENSKRDRGIRGAMWRRDNQRRRGERRRPVREIAAAHGVSRALCYYVQHRHLRAERPESAECPKCGGRGLIVDLETNSARRCSCLPAPRPPKAAPEAVGREDLERLDLETAIAEIPSSFASAAALAAASGSGASEMDVPLPKPDVDEEFRSPDPPDALGVRPEVAAGVAGDLPSSGRGDRRKAARRRGLHIDTLPLQADRDAPTAPSRGPPEPRPASHRPAVHRPDPLADRETGEPCLECRGLGFVGELGALEPCGSCSGPEPWARKGPM